MANDRFYPGIEEYLEDIENSSTITLSELDDLVDYVYAKVDLPKDSCKIIIKSILNEVKNCLLRGDKFIFANFGSLFISSPKVSKTAKKVFVKFKPAKLLLYKLNGK